MKEQNENDTSFLEYGPVKIVSGSFAGFAGYYDDDDDYKAVVYFGEPLLSEYELIEHKHLVKADEPYLPLKKFHKDHPDLAHAAGVPEG